MTVLSFDAGDRFFFRTWKDDAQDEAVKWTNVYEVEAQSGGVLSDIQTLGRALISFESVLHYANVAFTMFECGTWEPDSKPYDPLAFYSEACAAGTLGQRALPVATLQVPLQACLSVRRNVQTGRQGKLYYRGALSETDIEKAGAGWALTDAATIQGIIDDAVEALLAPYFSGGSVPFRFHLIGKNKAGTVFSRPVLSFEAYDAVWVQMEHAWYNRAQTPQP